MFVKLKRTGPSLIFQEYLMKMKYIPLLFFFFDAKGKFLIETFMKNINANCIIAS